MTKLFYSSKLIQFELKYIELLLKFALNESESIFSKTPEVVRTYHRSIPA
jgi:hypothetical protein